MPEKAVISISLPRGLRVPGAQIAGLLDLNVALAQEKNVEMVKLSLKGCLTTWVTVRGNNSSTKYTTRQAVFPDQTTVIWTPGMPLPPHTSGVASLPFAFTLPNANLPPSFHGGTSADGASVQYFVHAEGVRKQWYKFNIRLNAVFPFLSFDPSPAPGYPLPNWPYNWTTRPKVEKVRKGLFAHSGVATVEFIFPAMDCIPLFRPIPVRIRVVCRSKPLPISAANQPEAFDFPRNPKLSEIDLNLYLESYIRSSKTSAKRKVKNDLGLQAGFGRPDKVTDRAAWGKEVISNAFPPRWNIEERNPEKGYWEEEVTYSSTLIFRCPPPIATQYLTTTLTLSLIVDFPGLGNKVKMDIGPLNLTTGIPPPGTLPPVPPSATAQTPSEETVPSYEPPAPQYNLDLPPSYYDVVPTSDEKSEKS